MTCTVMIHEGVVPDELHGPLVDGLRTIYAAAVPTSDPAPRIITVQRGRWYTAGEQSHSSIVATTVPTGTDTQTRTKLLKQVCDFWCETTGCTPEAIVVTASNERG
jgi:hypothetical protein